MSNLPKVIGFAGKIGSGKTSACNVLQAHILNNLISCNGERVVESVRLDGNSLYVKYDGVDRHVDPKGILFPEQVEWLQNTLWAHIQQHDLADPIKKLVHDVCGVSYELLYGTQEQKSQPTDIAWGATPFRIPKIGIRKDTPMTVRDILKTFGEGFRDMCPTGDFWERIWEENVLNCGAERVVCGDIRWKVAVDKIQSMGGHVIGFTRQTEDDDHSSENSLEGCVFDAVIDNKDLSIGETHELVIEAASHWGFFS